MLLYVAVHPHGIYFLFSVGRLPQDLMFAFLFFAPTAGSLYDDK